MFGSKHDEQQVPFGSTVDDKGNVTKAEEASDNDHYSSFMDCVKDLVDNPFTLAVIVLFVFDLLYLVPGMIQAIQSDIQPDSGNQYSYSYSGDGEGANSAPAENVPLEPKDPHANDKQQYYATNFEDNARSGQLQDSKPVWNDWNGDGFPDNWRVIVLQ